MRNMLLGGKLLAVEAGAGEIALTHLKAALGFLQPTSTEHHALLCQALQLDPEMEQHERFSVQQLEAAASLPPFAL